MLRTNRKSHMKVEGTKCTNIPSCENNIGPANEANCHLAIDKRTAGSRVPDRVGCSQLPRSDSAYHHYRVSFQQQVGVGTRFRETRLMNGREQAVELEVAEYTENKCVRMIPLTSLISEFEVRIPARQQKLPDQP